MLPDAIVRFVLGRLDGTTTPGALAREVSEMGREGARVSESEADEVVRASLAVLAKAALLVG
jgi:hypothetical protein